MEHGLWGRGQSVELTGRDHGRKARRFDALGGRRRCFGHGTVRQAGLTTTDVSNFLSRGFKREEVQRLQDVWFHRAFFVGAEADKAPEAIVKYLLIDQRRILQAERHAHPLEVAKGTDEGRNVTSPLGHRNGPEPTRHIQGDEPHELVEVLQEGIDERQWVVHELGEGVHEAVVDTEADLLPVLLHDDHDGRRPRGLREDDQACLQQLLDQLVHFREQVSWHATRPLGDRLGVPNVDVAHDASGGRR